MIWAGAKRGYATIDDTLVGMNFGRREPQLVSVVVAGAAHARQDVADFLVVVEQSEQRFAAGPALADAENILCRGIEIEDQQVPVEQDHPRTQAVENGLRIAWCSVTAA